MLFKPAEQALGMDPAVETSTARQARLRREAADRKRRERARRKAEGQIDPRIIDKVLADAFRSLVKIDGPLGKAGDRPLRSTVSVEDVLDVAALDLLKRKLGGKRVFAILVEDLARP